MDRYSGYKPVLLAVLILAALVFLALAVYHGPPEEMPEAPVEVLTDYGYLHSESWSLTTSGADGSATGTGTSTGSVHGRIYGVYLDYSSGITTTTDVTLSQSSPAITALVVSNSATDAWYYPRVQVHNTAATGLTYDGTHTVNEPIPVNSTLTLAAGQSTPTQTVTITVYWGP